MSNTPQTAVRLSSDLLQKIARYVEQFRLDHPGLRFTTADAIRFLLETALAQVENNRQHLGSRKVKP